MRLAKVDHVDHAGGQAVGGGHHHRGRDRPLPGRRPQVEMINTIRRVRSRAGAVADVSIGWTHLCVSLAGPAKESRSLAAG